MIFVVLFGLVANVVVAQTIAESQIINSKEKKTYSGWAMSSLHDVDKSKLEDIQLWSGKTASALSTQMKDGFYVDVVDVDSSAESAGLEEDDVIVSFNGRRFKSIDLYEKWLEQTPPDKLTLVVFKQSDNYKKSTSIVVLPTGENDNQQKKNNSFRKKTPPKYETYTEQKEREKRELTTRIQNSLRNAVPVFEGSNIKEIQNIKQIFKNGEDVIYAHNLPKPYEANNSIRSSGYGGAENSLLLEGYKFIVIEKSTLNNIKEILTSTDAQNRETVLKEVLQELAKGDYFGEKLIEEEFQNIRRKKEDQESKNKQQELANHIKNSLHNAVPVFEGSSIKEILDVKSVFGKFGKVSLYSFDLPEPYKSNDTIQLEDPIIKENTILLNGYEFIVIKKSILNNIKDILELTDVKDKEMILNNFLKVENSKVLHTIVTIVKATDIEDRTTTFEKFLKEYFEAEKLLKGHSDSKKGLGYIASLDSHYEDLQQKCDNIGKKEFLTICLKEAKPLFVGCSIKKIQGIQEIYEAEKKSDSDSYGRKKYGIGLPEPYRLRSAITYKFTKNVTKYMALLDEHAVFFILQAKLEEILDIVNKLKDNTLKDKIFRYFFNIAKLEDGYGNNEDHKERLFNTLISFLKRIQESDVTYILTYLLSCNSSSDGEDILILSDSSSEIILLQISIDIKQKTVSALLELYPPKDVTNMSQLKSFRILDNNAFDFQSTEKKFDLNQKFAVDILNALIVNNGCCIRFQGNSEKKDIMISDQCSKNIKHSYDFFKRIEQILTRN
jgi:hypothetical protein